VDQKKPSLPEENDPLWDLLGKSRPATASPFFASRVVNAARAETRDRAPLLHWIFRPAWVLGAAAALAIAAALWPDPAQPATLANQDFEILANVDNLIVMDTQVIWDNSSAYLDY